MKCLLIADDLTGACDAAVRFRLRGAKTRVALTGATEPCEVLAVSTDSRGLCAAEAGARLR
ncbi:MAG: four-carbon acid sugar kinase family protein, partial [Acidobacteriota bacterium]